MNEIDKYLQDRQNYEIVEVQKKVYSVELQQIDLKKNQNKFYIIQLLQNKKGKNKNFILFTRWGKIGNKGQQTLIDSGNNLQIAINLYDQKYEEKIKNYSLLTSNNENQDNCKSNEQQQIQKPQIKYKQTQKINTKLKDLNKEENLNQNNQQQKENLVQVDDYCPNKNEYEVIFNENQIFSVFLEEQDKFYYLQAIRSKIVKDRKFFIYTRYGKKHQYNDIYCSKGTIKLSPSFKSQQLALDLYQEKYLDKTVKGKYKYIAQSIEDILQNQKQQIISDDQEKEEKLQEENQNQEKLKITQQIEQNYNQYRDENPGYTILVENNVEYCAYMEQDTKFYLVQILEKNNNYYLKIRYGKINQAGKQSISNKMTKTQAIQEYEKKYIEKSQKGGYSVINTNNNFNQNQLEQIQGGSQNQNTINNLQLQHNNYKQMQKNKFIMISSMNVIKNKIVKQQIFNNFLPKIINLTNNKGNSNDQKVKKFLKTPDKLQFIDVTKLELIPDNIEIYSELIQQIPRIMPNLKQIRIDYSYLFDVNNIELEKSLLLTFLSKYKGLQKLEMYFSQVLFQSEPIKKLANIISQMQDLNHLCLMLYEHKADRQSIKYLFKKILLLDKLETLSLEIYDEEPMPYRTAQKLFSHLKNFIFDYQEDYDVPEDEQTDEDTNMEYYKVK